MRPSRPQMQSFARHWPTGRPSVTTMLVALTVAAASAQWVFALFDRSEFLAQQALRDWLALSVGAVRDGAWWQFFSFTLLHAGPLHLLANVLVLYFAGREVEPIVGAHHFFGLYVLGNLCGGVAQWAAMAGGLVPGAAVLVGVSAGAAAVLAAFSTILPELEVTLLLFFVLPLRVRAKALGVGVALFASLLWLAQAGAEIGPVAMLAGSAVGWLYVRRLGFGNPLAFQRYLFARRQRTACLQRMPAGQFISQEIDPILDKISREGIHSLSRTERRVLEQGREKIAAKTTRR